MIVLKCPVCGAPVPPSKGVKPRKFCSLKCACKEAQSSFRRRRNEYARENEPTKLAAKALRKMQQEREDAKLKIRARLRARDAEYAASQCAAPVTVEERDLRNSELGQIVRIETRGRCCIGCRASGFVTHI